MALPPWLTVQGVNPFTHTCTLVAGWQERQACWESAVPGARKVPPMKQPATQAPVWQTCPWAQLPPGGGRPVSPVQEMVADEGSQASQELPVSRVPPETKAPLSQQPTVHAPATQTSSAWQLPPVGAGPLVGWNALVLVAGWQISHELAGLAAPGS